MKIKLLAYLATFSFLFFNTSFVFSADDDEEADEEETINNYNNFNEEEEEEDVYEQ